MEFVSIKENNKCFEDFEKLYFSAFPKQECLPINFVKRKAKTNKSDCFCLYEETTFIGLLNLVYYKDILLVFYFAVDENLRGKGYGSKILTELKNKFNNHRIILYIEPIDKDSDNYLQRVKRKAFYEKNGFKDCNYQVIENNVLYDTLYYKDLVPVKELKALLKKYMGIFLYLYYYKFPK